jgi:thiamine biosynthesis lipoprotein ApbE
MADSLSTALFNMELPEAKALVLEIEGVSALFVLANGETVRVDAK